MAKLRKSKPAAPKRRASGTKWTPPSAKRKSSAPAAPVAIPVSQMGTLLAAFKKDPAFAASLFRSVGKDQFSRIRLLLSRKKIKFDRFRL